MERYQVIGVVGGMGPYAGLDLVKKIFDNTDSHSDFAHLPVALLSYPERLPDRASYLYHTIEDNPAVELAEIARQLEQVGAVVAGMPCNTAHSPAIYDVMVDLIASTGNKIRMINMIDATAEFIRDEMEGVHRVGLLHTSVVYDLGVYEKAIREHGFEPILPDRDIQEAYVNATIYDSEWGIKAYSDPVTDRARASLITAIEHLIERGADTVVLGCTELPLAIPESHWLGRVLVDPTTVLARALIKAVHPEKLRPLAQVTATLDAR